MDSMKFGPVILLEKNLKGKLKSCSLNKNKDSRLPWRVFQRAKSREVIWQFACAAGSRLVLSGGGSTLRSVGIFLYPAASFHNQREDFLSRHCNWGITERVSAPVFLSLESHRATVPLLQRALGSLGPYIQIWQMVTSAKWPSDYTSVRLQIYCFLIITTKCLLYKWRQSLHGDVMEIYFTDSSEKFSPLGKEGD